jgi:murein DD-endopeptidase MepM/ murein hydrolase activator NlpD
MLDLILAASLALQLPIECRLGETCFIQQYFDHDAGPGAKDYRCGPLTYEGHDGTDFRIPTVAAQQRGVKVLAAAGGVVRGVRDGMEDVPVGRIGMAAVKDRECGNGVVLVHEDGWETQYCHMAKGSVRVKAGQPVKAGEILGLVGESGDAAFPHLHLSVRHGAQKVDPFAGPCSGGGSLWSPAAARALAYRSPELINWGFADGAVTMDEIEQGPADARRPGAQAPAIVAFARAIGLMKGDVLTLELSGPGGVQARGTPTVLDHDKAQYMLFNGARRPAQGWPKGVYAGRFLVTRGGAPVLERRFELQF